MINPNTISKLDQIKTLLFNLDPVKLIGNDNPGEYDHEAEIIYERINRYYSITKIQEIVYEVFRQQFGNGRSYKIFGDDIQEIVYKKRSYSEVTKIIGHFDDYREMSEEILKIIEAA